MFSTLEIDGWFDLLPRRSADSDISRPESVLHREQCLDRLGYQNELERTLDPQRRSVSRFQAPRKPRAANESVSIDINIKPFLLAAARKAR
jgi:hypothetical protein